MMEPKNKRMKHLMLDYAMPSEEAGYMVEHNLDKHFGEGEQSAKRRKRRKVKTY